jgi:TetR/AcrR family transcriptional regulator, transcriptional repressor for nem operon
MAAAATTQQRRAARERIVRAAAALIGEHGASGTSLDQVRAASGASQSQLYHYFGDKHGLVRAVVDHQATAVIESEREILGVVQNWDDLQLWAAAIVTGIEKRHAQGGCPIGTLAAFLADTDGAARQRLEQAFAEWREAIGTALTRLRDNGLLPRTPTFRRSPPPPWPRSKGACYWPRQRTTVPRCASRCTRRSPTSNTRPPRETNRNYLSRASRSTARPGRPRAPSGPGRGTCW